MAVTDSTSFVLALISCILIFSGMQMYKPWLISSQVYTILGGYLGSLLFVFSLTAVANLENIIFGKSFQVKIFPEVVFSIIFAVFTSATIHRVCATTCLLMSLCALYYVNKLSQKVNAVQVPVAVAQSSKKKK